MRMKKREIEKVLIELSLQYPVVTVTGPRQSGKTTLCRKVFPSKTYVNLEFPDIRQFALNDPRGFLNQYKDGAIFDEIQRVPELTSYIQGFVDESGDKNGQFILTGSQQFEVVDSINQSLVGRTALVKLLPFSISELGREYKDMSVNEFIYKGFYPRIYDKNLSPTQALGDYFETYVERDIKRLVNVKDLNLFEKFVKLCAGRVGQLLNLQSLANDVGVSHTTIKTWISVLEASYIIFLLPPFYKNISKRLIKSPKLYFYDVGVASFLLGIENIRQVSTHPLRGSLFENLIIMEVLKHRFNSGKKSNFTFFRDSSGMEVDLVLGDGREMLPIEIKAGETVNKDYFKSLNKFDKLFPGRRKVSAVIYAGERIEKRTGVSVYPARKTKKLIQESGF